MTVERIVHIVDDDASVLRAMERLLSAAGFATRCYTTGRAILRAPPHPGGCILLDLCMPDMDGLALQARLRALAVALPVIVITGKSDVPTAVQAMKGGAFDFMEKPFDDEVLLATIEAALGADHNSRDHELRAAADQIARLSRREREVLDAVVAGRPNKLMAHDLKLSVRTVEGHRARMMERLGARQLGEAVRLAVLAQIAKRADGADG